ncbi:hypothetical protein [Pseudogemmobacter sonorensis]|uniref:hypothetical protein n=1 Tax=Pseudogemmobacter sonorensis TaxID=2989681 RepID=UPI0036CC628B
MSFGMGLTRELAERPGEMPAPKRVYARTIWDVRALDLAFDALPGTIQPPKPMTGTERMKLLRKPPRYCQGFEDRHGTFRWYYRRPGFPRCALPGLPWTPEFMAAYEKAANGEKLEIGVKQTIAGSVSALVVSFYKTSDFTNLSDSTKATYRGIIERFRAEHGDKRVAHMERKHLQKLVSDKAATPAAANNMLRMVHLLMLPQGARHDGGSDACAGNAGHGRARQLCRPVAAPRRYGPALWP